MELKDRMHQIETMFSEMLLKMDEHSEDITSMKKDLADLKLDASKNRTFQIQVSQAIIRQSDDIQFLLRGNVEIKENQVRMEGKIDALQEQVHSKIDALASYLREKLG